VLIGIAKPIPMLPSEPVSPVEIAELTPTTWPCAFSSGPPELPWLSAASVWMTRSNGRALRGRQRAVERADDPERDAAVESERVPDGGYLVSDVNAVGVAEREGLERPRARLHLEQGHVGRRILPDDLGLHRVVVREADVDGPGVADDVVVRDDVAGLVDDEARAERALHLGARRSERIAEPVGLRELDLRRRRDLDDTRRVAVVDRTNREWELLGGLRDVARGIRLDEFANRGCVLTRPDERSADDRDRSARERRREQRAGHRQGFFAHG
jgi:hypothetical protein